MRYISVTVVDQGGRPQTNVRVCLFLHQFMASGMTPTQHTDREGRARFAINLDSGGDVSVYVAGSERVKRGAPQAEYWVTV